MKTTIASIRSLIKEELQQDDVRARAAYKEANDYLQLIIDSGKTYLKGQWKKEYRKGGGETWVAEDPVLGPVELRYDSSTSYGMDGRLRNPSKTRYSNRAKIVVPGIKHPAAGFGNLSIDAVDVSGVGESRYEVLRSRVSAKMSKLFGVDPYDYKNAAQKPEADKWKASAERMANDAFKDAEVPAEVPVDAPVGDPVTPAAKIPTTLPTGKELKIYGKLKGAPAHTRLKGKAYLAGADTKFKNGERAAVAPEGEKLRVKKNDSDHAQLWDPE